ncbi:hypothetical protein G5B38_01870 [Pseudohalocynthiibacter aestuariivivens]|uniref:Cytochrome oxidase subunit III n=1 Tax=Roseovarius pelagicus TaxID=2980108 RepID=A0ABY6DC87_9RHOB|nr:MULTISPECIES: hypothetical protein [Rhodobacterales]QIE44376.1 hypothetical protein G5B38_01870 [Pseudohalocynthiibacter aestuariivivens]UXX83708.1 hypothetical protein N7U68_03280 [Roseovarius pelagicus]
MSPRVVWAFNFTGWILFTFSAVGFVWTTWRAGDMIGLAASLFFLIACLVFLVPVWAHRPGRRD